jgi:hypothetical protein
MNKAADFFDWIKTEQESVNVTQREKDLLDIVNVKLYELLVWLK